MEKEFWESHPYVSILTPEKNYLYQIYSCYQSPNVSKTYNCQFSGEEQYQDYLNYTMEQSLYDTGISASSSDRIITLSTCNNDWEDTRMVGGTRKANQWIKNLQLREKWCIFIS